MRNVTLPLSEADAASLRAGESVLLSGKIFTARDAAHKRLAEAIQSGQPLPLELAGASVYYTGPCPAKDGDTIGSCGPTTSSRMDSFTPLLLEHGLKVMVGKGKRSPQVVQSIAQHKAVYFAAVGGAGALYADCVKSLRFVAYNDLLSEAIYELEIADFPCLVAVDSLGAGIY